MRRRIFAYACLGWSILAASACGSSSDKSPTAPQFDTLPVDSATVDAALAFELGTQFVVPPLCSSDPVINCTGGVPGAPIPIALKRDSLMVTSASPNVFTFTVWLEATSSADIPVSIAGYNCGLHIDTTPGASKSLGVEGIATFSSASLGGPSNALELRVNSMSSVEAADLAITGGSAGCIAAAASLNLYINTLITDLTSVINADAPALCGAPGPSLFEVCPTPPLADVRRTRPGA